MKILKENFAVKFVVSLFVFSIIAGIFLYIIYKPNLDSYIYEFKDIVTASKQNTFIKNIGILSIIFVLSLSIIGSIGIVFYTFYEGFCTGFTLASFIGVCGIKGASFYTLFFIVSKSLFVLAMLYFSIVCLHFVFRLCDALLRKDKEEVYRNVLKHFYRYIILLFIIILNSTLIYFFANKILTLFINLI